MSKNHKGIKISVLLVIFILYISGCASGVDYNGEHPELYSIAINSLLGATGYLPSEVRFEPRLEVMEEDGYGRKMFTYYEAHAISTHSIIISQKSDDNYVYFYPDYNFISAPKNNFSAEEIEELKRKNDWGKEIDTDKCIKVEIVRKKSEGSLDETSLKQLYKIALGKDARYNNKFAIVFLIKDDYNRSIYVGHGISSSERHVVMLFKPDGSYDESKCLMELSDLYSYQDELKNFKDLNDWNKPVNQ